MWMNRNHGEVNIYLTQFLSDHGCFRKYLYIFGHAESPHCPDFPNTEETSQHVVFTCPRYVEVRNDMLGSSDGDLNPDNIVQKMCQHVSTRHVVNRAITHIMSSMQQKWPQDQRASSLDRCRLDPPSETKPSSSSVT